MTKTTEYTKTKPSFHRNPPRSQLLRCYKNDCISKWNPPQCWFSRNRCEMTKNSLQWWNHLFSRNSRLRYDTHRFFWVRFKIW